MSTSSQKHDDVASASHSNNNHPLEKLTPSVGFLSNPFADGPIKFFTCEFDKQSVVVLSRSSWESLVKLFGAMEKLQIAMGKGFMTVQPMQVAHRVTHREQELVILPVNAWQRLVRQIEDCSNACDWDRFSFHVEQLKAEQTPSPALPPSEHPVVDIHLADVSVFDTFDSGEDSNNSSSPPIARP